MSGADQYDYDVFLSCSHTDREYARDLSRHLSDLGFVAWLDDSDVSAGEDWRNKIKMALERSSVCVLLLGSGTSPGGDEESRVAIDNRIQRSHGEFRVIPVVLPGTRLDDPYCLPVARTTWLIPWMQSAFIQFEDSLDEHDKIRELVLRIRGVGFEHNVLLRNAAIQNFARHRAKNALNVDWKKLAKQHRWMRKEWLELFSDSCKCGLIDDASDEPAPTNERFFDFDCCPGQWLRDGDVRSMHLACAVVCLFLWDVTSDHSWKEPDRPSSPEDEVIGDLRLALRLPVGPRSSE